LAAILKLIGAGSSQAGITGQSSLISAPSAAAHFVGDHIAQPAARGVSNFAAAVELLKNIALPSNVEHKDLGTPCFEKLCEGGDAFLVSGFQSALWR